MEKNKIKSLYQKLEDSDKHPVKRKLFAPYYTFLEHKLYKNFWLKTIARFMLTNDNFFQFLEQEEFAYEVFRFRKGDIFTGKYEFFDRKTNQETISALTKEYRPYIVKMIQNNTGADFENYIKMDVSLETVYAEPDNDSDEMIGRKAFFISLFFIRYEKYQAIKHSISNIIYLCTAVIAILMVIIMKMI